MKKLITMFVAVTVAVTGFGMDDEEPIKKEKIVDGAALLQQAKSILVCDRGSERMYVQVTYLMPTKETREREFGALLAIPDQFPKMVLSLDRLNLGGNGILHMYIPEFLLN